jgi:hypothetical protein
MTPPKSEQVLKKPANHKGDQSMKYEPRNIRMKDLPEPCSELPQSLPVLSRDRYAARLSKFRQAMKINNLEAVVIYGDREHYANFKYFVGFEPRFEEALLVIFRDDPSYLILGNECEPMHRYAQLDVEILLCQTLSLPSQPMHQSIPVGDLLARTGLGRGIRTGVVGWKLFTPLHGADYQKLFDLPSFIMDDLISIVGIDDLYNVTGLLIDPAQNGIRIQSDADELAVLEYGAAMAAQGVASVLANVRPGISELELANCMGSQGSLISCHPLLLAGPNVDRGMVSPTSYVIQAGDPFVTSYGLEGGLTCREGYVVSSVDELPESLRRYLDDLAKPYFAAVASWYSTIGLNVSGKEIYDVVNSIIPKEKFGWKLNPGHLTSTEEWLSSPIDSTSELVFTSGMTVQMDIIPNAPPYCGVNAEDGVCLADEALRGRIAEQYPDLWQRFQLRRHYMEDALRFPADFQHFRHTEPACGPLIA